MKVLHNKRGFTLIELVISMAISLIVITVVMNFLSFTYSNSYRGLDSVVHMRNTRFALNYIEKRLRDLDQTTIVYHSNLKAIEGFTDTGLRRWIDLSGFRRNSAFIYFNRPTRQLRVNINNENNVLVSFIRDVEVRELDSGNLIEIEVFASEIDYSVKSRFHVNRIIR